MLRRSYADADCVIGIGEYVRDILGDIPLKRFHAMGDIGIASLPAPVDRRGRQGTVRVLFAGRVVRSKGVRNAIRAFALLGDLDARLDILGEGADVGACADLISSLGLGDRVTMHGRVPRARVDDFYAESDVFLFPSYREPGGLVVGEAMSHGLPAVVCARGGPADTIDDTSGIRVRPDGEAAYEQGLADALRRLVQDPGLRLSLGKGARARIARIGLWPHKVEVMDRLYADALASVAHNVTPTGEDPPDARPDLRGPTECVRRGPARGAEPRRAQPRARRACHRPGRAPRDGGVGGLDPVAGAGHLARGHRRRELERQALGPPVGARRGPRGGDVVRQRHGGHR